MRAEEFRQRWGLTQQAIADLIDTSKSSIAHWSSGGDHDQQRKEPPSVERLLDLLHSTFLLLESNPAIIDAWMSRGGDRRKRKG